MEIFLLSIDTQFLISGDILWLFIKFIFIFPNCKSLSLYVLLFIQIYLCILIFLCNFIWGILICICQFWVSSQIISELIQISWSRVKKVKGKQRKLKDVLSAHHFNLWPKLKCLIGSLIYLHEIHQPSW